MYSGVNVILCFWLCLCPVYIKLLKNPVTCSQNTDSSASHTIISSSSVSHHFIINIIFIDKDKTLKHNVTATRCFFFFFFLHIFQCDNDDAMILRMRSPRIMWPIYVSGRSVSVLKIFVITTETNWERHSMKLLVLLAAVAVATAFEFTAEWEMWKRVGA